MPTVTAECGAEEWRTCMCRQMNLWVYMYEIEPGDNMDAMLSDYSGGDVTGRETGKPEKNNRKTGCTDANHNSDETHFLVWSLL